jgi:predicted O-linked N-acetylglucosamine transferase (SPINDLY family)
MLNRLTKVMPRMIRLWADILDRVPGSRLAVLGPHGLSEANVRAVFARGGIDPARVDVLPPRPRRGYLEHFARIDVLLDPFPYHGMTTTCDGLWMGVPAVTLAGDRHVSTVGVSLLSAVGLPELVAHTPEQYVEVAARLASDLPALAAVRSTLRERTAASPLCDPARVARALEAAYRRMWEEWCAESRLTEIGRLGLG